MTQHELYHLLFLSDVVISGKKTELMEDTVKSLMYVAKAIKEIELSDPVAEQLDDLTKKIETALRNENERSKEINVLMNEQFSKHQYRSSVE